MLSHKVQTMENQMDIIKMENNQLKEQMRKLTTEKAAIQKETNRTLIENHQLHTKSEVSINISSIGYVSKNASFIEESICDDQSIISVTKSISEEDENINIETEFLGREDDKKLELNRVEELQDEIFRKMYCQMFEEKLENEHICEEAHRDIERIQIAYNDLVEEYEALNLQLARDAIKVVDYQDDYDDESKSMSDELDSEYSDNDFNALYDRVHGSTRGLF